MVTTRNTRKENQRKLVLLFQEDFESCVQKRKDICFETDLKKDKQIETKEIVYSCIDQYHISQTTMTIVF